MGSDPRAETYGNVSSKTADRYAGALNSVCSIPLLGQESDKESLGRSQLLRTISTGGSTPHPEYHIGNSETGLLGLLAPANRANPPYSKVYGTKLENINQLIEK